MKIGLSYDVKTALPPVNPNQPEDAYEEYDSPETIEALGAAIRAQGHSTVKLGGGREFLKNVLAEPVDFVFNIAEGRGNYRSREAQVPAVLEMLDIPYSGSDPQCLAICLDKPLADQMVAWAGVTTPRYRVVSSLAELKDVDWKSFPTPVFMKPMHEGSSMGVRVTSRRETPAEINTAIAGLLETYRQPVMVMEFITGDEVTVGIVGNPPQVIGMMRILPRTPNPHFIYSLEVKRDYERLVEYECPACLAPEVLAKIEESSLMAFNALGCRDFARVDFRITPAGVPYFLEINPLPGLNPKSSDIVIMARKMGWSYEGLVAAILKAALERNEDARPGRHRL